MAAASGQFNILLRALGASMTCVSCGKSAKTLFILSVVFCSLLSIPVASGQVNILTNKMDNARTGQNIRETILTTANVNSTQFAKLFAVNVDGYVSAQPLYMSALNINGGTHNVVFVATEHNSVYAIDADTGVQLWQVNLGPSVPVSIEGCPNVTGLIETGILSTPVIDPATNSLYLTAKTYAAGVATYSLHALDVTTGQEKAWRARVDLRIGGRTHISCPRAQAAAGTAALQRHALSRVRIEWAAI